VPDTRARFRPPVQRVNRVNYVLVQLV
jgi:hypothetical protein